MFRVRVKVERVRVKLLNKVMVSFFLSIQWMEVVGHLSVRISFNIGVIFQVIVI